MNITVMIPSMDRPGGIERVTAVQANYWSTRLHHHVTIITYRNPECNSYFPLDEGIGIINYPWFDYDIWYEKIPIIGSLVKMRRKTQLYHQRFVDLKSDLIVSMMHGPENNFLSYAAGDIPTIGVNHVTMEFRDGTYADNFMHKVYQVINYQFLKKNIRNYNHVISLSKTDLLKLKAIGCRASFIPNPFSMPSCSADTLQHREKRIVMVGRIDHLKGQSRLLDIWAEMARKYPEWTLTFIGDGRDAEKLKKRCGELGIENQTEFTGNIKNVRERLLQAAIFAFTSRTESFGMVLLEAMSCGLPVVTYDCENGPRDIIDNYYNGFLVPDGDSDCFERRLSILMNDEHLRVKLATNALASVERFRDEVVMKEWDDLLEQTRANK